MGAGEEILKALARIEGKLDRALAAQSSGGGGALPVADDRDLDGEHGNPEVRFVPKKWTGASMKGRRYADCPPEFLDELASSLAYFAEHPKPGREDKAKYDWRDAARARGWAKRLRSGWKSPAQEATDATTPADEMEAPF